MYGTAYGVDVEIRTPPEDSGGEDETAYVSYRFFLVAAERLAVGFAGALVGLIGAFTGVFAGALVVGFLAGALVAVGLPLGTALGGALGGGVVWLPALGGTARIRHLGPLPIRSSRWALIRASRTR